MTTLHGNILIVGSSCTGKSTLAAELSKRTGLRMVELDALFWAPGWNRAPAEAFRERVTGATVEDGWVAAGNYSAVRDVLWPRAETAIWLDFDLRVAVTRIIRRSWRRWRAKELLWGTNYERFWVHFLPNDRSLVWYTVRTHRRRRRDLAQAMGSADWPNLRWVRLRTPRDVERWLARIPDITDRA